VAGELGYCPPCDARYHKSRDDGERLAAAARARHWELFAWLDEPQARRLAEHLVGNARIERRSIMHAVADFIAEASDVNQPAGDRASGRGRLRAIDGGAA
jgi:hypothetical protein